MRVRVRNGSKKVLYVCLSVDMCMRVSSLTSLSSLISVLWYNNKTVKCYQNIIYDVIVGS